MLVEVLLCEMVSGPRGKGQVDKIGRFAHSKRRLNNEGLIAGFLQVFTDYVQ